MHWGSAQVPAHARCCCCTTCITDIWFEKGLKECINVLKQQVCLLRSLSAVCDPLSTVAK